MSEADGVNWELVRHAVVTGCAVLGGIGMIARSCSPEAPDLVVAVRVAILDHESTLGMRAMHVTQRKFHWEARFADERLQSVRVGQCVWLERSERRRTWVYVGPAPEAACMDGVR